MSAPPICLVTPYPPGRAHLGGGGWIDRRLREALVDEGADVAVVSVTGPDGRWEEGGIPGRSAGDVPLEVRGDRRRLARIVAAMLRGRDPYLEAKFTAFPGWAAAVEALREEADGRRLVTSGWPPLVLAHHAGLAPDVHIAHNVETLIAAGHAPRPLRLLGERSRLERRERDLLAGARSVVTLSRTDADRLGRWSVPATPLPLPLRPVADGSVSRPRSIGFIGKAGWPPNAEALDVLLGPVHEALVARGVTVDVVLGGAGTEVHRDHPWVRRSGPVEDLDAFYDEVGLVVVPRLGESTGVSVKVLEAAEHGVPVVVPASLAAAIDPDGPWEVADEPEDLAEAIARWAASDGAGAATAAWAARQRPQATAEAVFSALR